MVLPTNRARLNADWLLKLRWVAVVGQLLTVTIVYLVLQIPLFVEPLLVNIAATAISNLLLQKWIVAHDALSTTLEGSRRFDMCMGLVSTMDLLSLTALLYATGGAANPFFLFYFVNLALSAILLPRNWVWGLNLLAILSFGFLLYDHYPVEILTEGSHFDSVRWSGIWTLRQIAMIVAFAACSSVIVYFLTRLTFSLRQHEMDLREAQRLKAASEKLEALGTLAAGAAHELATPLSTIAVVAREVEMAIESHSCGNFDGETVDDIRLIRCELDRCRKILDRMSADAGQTIAEAIQHVSWNRLKTETLAGLPDSERVDWRANGLAETDMVPIPLMGLSQALRGLIQNGFDASEPQQRVLVDVELSAPESCTITICDQGQGMSRETASRAGQPFFTTKPPGKGMGLGVFLADSVVRRLGGQMEFQSLAGSGTKVRIRLPIVGQFDKRL